MTPYTDLAREKGILTWDALKSYIAALPYGRTSNPKDALSVLQDGRGTCSGKHAYLACYALENAIPHVRLMISLFKMSAESTPKIADVLTHFHLDYIPEAHCYLLENNVPGDYTRPGKFFNDFEKRILETHELDPEKAAEQKTALHKAYMKKWLSEMFLPYSFEEIWRIREACIASL